VKAVAEELRFSRSHAGRFVGEARKVSQLPPVSPGRASDLEAEFLEWLSGEREADPSEWPPVVFDAEFIERILGRKLDTPDTAS
jgi:hypothetical protein